jgi:hypothetical protein
VNHQNDRLDIDETRPRARCPWKIYFHSKHPTSISLSRHLSLKVFTTEFTRKKIFHECLRRNESNPTIKNWSRKLKNLLGAKFFLKKIDSCVRRQNIAIRKLRVCSYLSCVGGCCEDDTEWLRNYFLILGGGSFGNNVKSQWNFI